MKKRLDDFIKKDEKAAISAAAKERRFSPIELAEEIGLLINDYFVAEVIMHLDEIEINFPNKQRFRLALYELEADDDGFEEGTRL